MESQQLSRSVGTREHRSATSPFPSSPGSTLDERFDRAAAGFAHAPARKQLSRRHRWTLIVVAVVALVILAVALPAIQPALDDLRNGNVVRYSAAEAGYSVEFPGDPQVTRATTIVNGQSLEAVTASAQSNRGVYAVTTVELGSVVQADDAQSLIQSTVVELVQENGGQLSENRTVTVAGEQAAQGVFSIETGRDYHFLVLYRGSTQVILLSTMNKPADSDAFVDSLRFTD